MPVKDAPGQNLDTSVDTGSPLDSARDGNAAPTADAGGDVSAEVGRVVTLDGSGSSDPDGDPLEYGWEIVKAPSGSAATLINKDKADPQFIPDVDGVYDLVLVVSDGARESEPDRMAVTAAMTNGKPVANAGPDQTVNVGDTVRLNGSSSADPDGDALQFTWTLTTRPSGSATVLTSSTSPTPSFTADVAGSYEVGLTVSDGDSTSQPHSVRAHAPDEAATGSSGCGCRTASIQDGGGDALMAAILAFIGLRPRRRVPEGRIA